LYLTIVGLDPILKSISTFKFLKVGTCSSAGNSEHNTDPRLLYFFIPRNSLLRQAAAFHVQEEGAVLCLHLPRRDHLQAVQGPLLLFLKYFRQKIRRKKLALFTQTTVSFCLKLIIALVFEKNANFFAESRQK
jgi:hypothetical protein